MNLAELVALTVGDERYRQACECAWRGAAATGRERHEPWPDGLEDVPHELGDLWERDELPLARRLDLALALYRAMPCYANTMYVSSYFRELGADARRTLWDAYREWLGSDDDRLAGPVEYSLWVDLFEDHGVAAEAWRETTRQDVAPSRRRLARVLRAAGPVPWNVKAPLLDELLADRDWHRDVLRALEGSAFDVCGEIDRRTVRRWLGRLALPPAELEPLSSAVRSR